MTASNRLNLEVGDAILEGTILTPARLIPGVLFVHGWGGSQEQDMRRAEDIAQMGCVCFTFDLRGHAKTEPQRMAVARDDGLADVLAAYDFLASQPMVDKNAIAVVGASYGGYLATLLTAQRPVHWLALRVPALYPDTEWKTPKALLDRKKIAQFRNRFRGFRKNRSLEACAKFKGDVLIVESEYDTVVPHPTIASFIAAFTSANSLSYRIIKGGDHALRDEAVRKSYHDLLVTWVSEMVRGARRAEPNKQSHQA
ncbi:alpha/beta hydrolase family protein [Brevundimonas sp.]|uniref:alpha/beta hydrolase family protein n=1 Tax=Brevundimonas sp. TaxID=1871086 RepID=UPI0037C01DAF